MGDTLLGFLERAKQWLRSALSKGRESPTPNLKTETRLVSETSCFVVIYNSRRWQKPTNPVDMFHILQPCLTSPAMHWVWQKLNSMILVRERTIPTERPPLVGEVIANFCGQRELRGQRYGSLRPYSRLSRQEPLLFYQVAPQLYSRGWVDPVPDPLRFFFW
jgi:hypothetical protein